MAQEVAARTPLFEDLEGIGVREAREKKTARILVEHPTIWILGTPTRSRRSSFRPYRREQVDVRSKWRSCHLGRGIHRPP